MIWILLLYVLPLVISVLMAYYIIKKDNGTVKSFLEPLPYLFIPFFNIMIIVVGLFFIVDDWIKNNDKWQDFLNKKL
jgi:UDP-N-acetylmuramyl pentapeptide phosphotransferase/UDP-N-acetylglucosamine-1-phosphate transferase